MNIPEQAIAYLKGSPPEGDKSALELSPKDSPVVRPHLDCLHVCYLVDDKQSYAYIQNRHMEEEGITADELHQIGLRNLRNQIAQSTPKVRPYGNIFSFIAGGSFEASVMLLDEFWDNEFRKFVKGEYAIAIPARDVLAFCDEQSDQGVIELQQVINRVWPTGDHIVSDKIYIKHQDKWQIRTRAN